VRVDSALSSSPWIKPHLDGAAMDGGTVGQPSAPWGSRVQPSTEAMHGLHEPLKT